MVFPQECTTSEEAYYKRFQNFNRSQNIVVSQETPQFSRISESFSETLNWNYSVILRFEIVYYD